MAQEHVHRFFGGPPLAVVGRLILLSILVGVILAAIGLDPWNILELGSPAGAAHLEYGLRCRALALAIFPARRGDRFADLVSGSAGSRRRAAVERRQRFAGRARLSAAGMTEINRRSGAARPAAHHPRCPAWNWSRGRRDDAGAGDAAGSDLATRCHSHSGHWGRWRDRCSLGPVAAPVAAAGRR